MKSQFQIPPDLMNFDQDYFPQYTLFLLSDEEKNISNFKERIAKEKQRVVADIDIFKQEVVNLVDDIKQTLLEKIDEHFLEFIEKYKKFKNEVIDFKNVNLEIPQQHLAQPGPRNPTNGSNQQLINELENLRVKSQIAKIQQYITEIQKENYNRILQSSQEILSLMSQSQQLYNSQQACNTLREIKGHFAQNLQIKFELLNQYIKSTYAPDDQDLGGKESMVSQYQQHQQSYMKNTQDAFNSDHKLQQQQLFNIHDDSRSNISVQNYPVQDNYQPYQQTRSIISKIQNQQLLDFPQSFPRQEDLNVQLKYQIPTTHNSIQLCLYAFSENIIVSGSKDGIIEVYDVNLKKYLGSLQGHQGSICTLGRIGNYLASGSDHGDCSIILWDMQTFTQKKKLIGHQAAVVKLLPITNDILVSASYDKNIIFWDIQSEQQIQIIGNHQSSITCLSYCEQDNILVSASLDNSLIVHGVRLDISTQNLTVEHRNSFNVPACIVQMQIVAGQLISGHADGNIRKINLFTGEVEMCIKVSMNAISDFLILKDSEGALKVLGTGLKESSFFAVDLADQRLQRLQNIQGLYAQFGCGIGPKLQHIQDNVIASISQLNEEKQITIMQYDFGI